MLIDSLISSSTNCLLNSSNLFASSKTKRNVVGDTDDIHKDLFTGKFNRLSSLIIIWKVIPEIAKCLSILIPLSSL